MGEFQSKRFELLRRAGVSAMAVFCLLLLYLLSIGPACLLNKRGVLPNWGKQAYRPLHPVMARYEFFAHAMSRYQCWWLGTPYTPVPRTKTPPLEGLVDLIGSITNGQTSFQIFVPSKVSQGGHPTSQDAALAQIVGRVREHGLFPAVFEQQSDGRLYTFEREREWEGKKE